jgi:SAM-dependent methyltransferase
MGYKTIMKRRPFLKTALLVLIPLKVFPLNVLDTITRAGNNFKTIYSNSKFKSEFYKFLKNVFNLFPEDKLHKLIAETTSKKSTDKEVYLEAQAKLDTITPFFSSFNYKLPALMKQKEEMAKQTAELLGKGSTFNGYLEIGSSGRYLDYLEEVMNIKGERYYADGKAPGYGITEMVDRGQINIGATYIPMADYLTDYAAVIPNGSLDLVTVYIGFHHCPINLRTSYISSIRDTMRVGGKLILRDHDCDTEHQKTLVALAHDVFNMGTNETWEYNSKEVRNFYSLEFICSFIEKTGFKFDKRTLFQEGDPTKNALMMFTKI